MRLKFRKCFLTTALLIYFARDTSPAADQVLLLVAIDAGADQVATLLRVYGTAVRARRLGLQQSRVR